MRSAPSSLPSWATAISEPAVTASLLMLSGLSSGRTPDYSAARKGLDDSVGALVQSGFGSAATPLDRSSRTQSAAHRRALLADNLGRAEGEAEFAALRAPVPCQA